MKWKNWIAQENPVNSGFPIAILVIVEFFLIARTNANLGTQNI